MFIKHNYNQIAIFLYGKHKYKLIQCRLRILSIVIVIYFSRILSSERASVGFVTTPAVIICKKLMRTLRFTNYALPITLYQLRFTNYQLPITNYQLPITNYFLLNTKIKIRNYKLVLSKNFRKTFVINDFTMLYNVLLNITRLFSALVSFISYKRVTRY